MRCHQFGNKKRKIPTDTLRAFSNYNGNIFKDWVRIFDTSGIAKGSALAAMVTAGAKTNIRKAFTELNNLPDF